jgi:hypothetical protein
MVSAGSIEEDEDAKVKGGLYEEEVRRQDGKDRGDAEEERNGEGGEEGQVEEPWECHYDE